MPNYICNGCGLREYNEAGNPLNQSEDGKDLCNRCYRDRHLKCQCCGKSFHHEELGKDPETKEMYCQRCILITE